MCSFDLDDCSSQVLCHFANTTYNVWLHLARARNRVTSWFDSIFRSPAAIRIARRTGISALEEKRLRPRRIFRRSRPRSFVDVISVSGISTSMGCQRRILLTKEHRCWNDNGVAGTFLFEFTKTLQRNPKKNLSRNCFFLILIISLINR